MRAILPSFFALKAVQVAIVVCCPLRFDTSSDLVFSQHLLDEHLFVHLWPSLLRPAGQFLVNSFLKKLVTWDVVYFADLFATGLKYEHQFVFCPLWWRWIKYTSPDNFYTKLALSVLWTNLFHLLSCVSMYYLALATFAKISMFRQRKRAIALAASLAYVVSPAGIFLTAPYSESLCNLLVVTGLWLRELALAKNTVGASFGNVRLVVLYTFSGTLVAIAFGVRANSVLFGLFYLFDLQNAWRNHHIQDCVWTIVAGGQIFAAIVVAVWYPYSVFCPERGQWCTWWVPSLFSYAQSTYWVNGFLAYWTPNNIPNFAFAAPTVLSAAWASSYFLVDYPAHQLLPHVAVTFALVCGAVFFWNVQIVTRIASVLPLPYFYVGCLATLPLRAQNLWAKYIAVFVLLWILVQTGLFAAFLPPA